MKICHIYIYIYDNIIVMYVIKLNMRVFYFLNGFKIILTLSAMGGDSCEALHLENNLGFE